MLLLAVAVLVVVGLLGLGYARRWPGVSQIGAAIRETRLVEVARDEVARLTAAHVTLPRAVPDPNLAGIGTVFVVNEAATANPNLVPTRLMVPPGLPERDATLQMPPGFTISVLAAGLDQPRFMTLDEAGNLLVGTLRDGAVYRFPRDASGSYAPLSSPPAPLLKDLNAPTSLALHDGYLYVGETDQITRYHYDPRGELSGPEVIIPDLPGRGLGHTTRTVVFGPDGMLYLSVGSSCNLCPETDERRAAILRFTPDGGGGVRYAWGLRNAVGLAFQPTTGRLWATVAERDFQGPELPPDMVTLVGPGQDFGWPDCQPPDARPQTPGATCEGITPPTLGLQAHSTPLGLAFYTGAMFPEEFRGDLFVAQHGSYDRQPPAMPKLLRIHFEGNRPVRAEDFVAGWQGSAPDYQRVGRPAGVIVAPDGSLIVSDDMTGVLYRIAYTG